MKCQHCNHDDDEGIDPVFGRCFNYFACAFRRGYLLTDEGYRTGEFERLREYMWYNVGDII